MQAEEVPDVMKQEMVDDALADIAEAERVAVSYKPEEETFIGSVLTARESHKDNTTIMKDACLRLCAEAIQTALPAAH